MNASRGLNREYLRFKCDCLVQDVPCRLRKIENQDTQDAELQSSSKERSLETDGRDESATQPRELTGLVADAGVVGKANVSKSRMNYDRSVSQPSGTLLVIFCVTSRFYGPPLTPSVAFSSLVAPSSALTKMPTIVLQESHLCSSKYHQNSIYRLPRGLCITRL